MGQPHGKAKLGYQAPCSASLPSSRDLVVVPADDRRLLELAEGLARAPRLRVAPVGSRCAGWSRRFPEILGQRGANRSTLAFLCSSRASSPSPPGWDQHRECHHHFVRVTPEEAGEHRNGPACRHQVSTVFSIPGKSWCETRWRGSPPQRMFHMGRNFLRRSLQRAGRKNSGHPRALGQPPMRMWRSMRS